MTTYDEFLEYVKDHVVLLDGAMGTMIQQLGLMPADFGGESYLMLGDLLSFSRPDDLMEIHLQYLRAGAHAIETNTFGASALRLGEYDFKDLDTTAFRGVPEGVDLSALSAHEMAREMSLAAVAVARRAVEAHKADADYDGRPLYVVGSIGPSNYVLSPTDADLKRGTWELIEENFFHQVTALLDGGVDILLFETQQDVLELKAAVSGAKKAMAAKGVRLPLMAQVTVNEFSRMQIFNTDIVAASTTIAACGVDVFGINCSIGPDLMEPIIKKLSETQDIPISVLPNAGMPESEFGRTVYRLGPDLFADQLEKFVTQYGVSMVGGCCGTSPDHIRAISQRLKGVAPAKRNPDGLLRLSGPQDSVVVEEGSFLRIGERLNVRGSKKVRDAVESEGPMDVDALAEVVREQIEDLGTPVLDVCMDSNVVETPEVLPAVIQAMTGDFRGVMSIDSFDPEALAAGVKAYPGRPLINSISMESVEGGISKAEQILKATAFHSPLYIGLCADDTGPAQKSDEKVRVAKTMVDLCGKYDIASRQLFVDINAFPIGSESDEGLNFALESLNSIPKIKALAPGLKTTIGVSNLTNGLARKPYMRMVLTSVFLDEGKKLGLDAAIVNPNHYVPVESIDKTDYELALAIILNRDMDAYEDLEEVASAKSGLRKVKKKNYEDLSADEAVCERIKDGVREARPGTLTVRGAEFAYKDAVVVQAAEALKTIEPVEFISGHLMVAMEELGARFARGEVSLPHLLKSADVMKQVMTYIEAVLGTSEGGAVSYKGTLVLGTVFQDVHSIGKDLTRTLLENYGYRVIDLGVQVPLAEFIETAKRENADAIGMSSLLVQTAGHMITVAAMAKAENLEIPILIGGAPVNMKHGAAVAMAGDENPETMRSDVFYCDSSMTCVNVMENLCGRNRDAFIAANGEALKAAIGKKTGVDPAALPALEISFDGLTDSICHGTMTFSPKVEALPLNRKALLALNWREGSRLKRLERGLTDEAANAEIDVWLKDAEDNGWVVPKGRVALYPCNSDGDDLVVLDPDAHGVELCRIPMPIMALKGKKVSLARYFRPATDGITDVVGFQMATAGLPSAQQVDAFQKENESAAAHLLQGVADRVAEDFATCLNDRAKKMAGFSNGTGKRFSPGYPGVNIEANRQIFGLLRGESLGATLTDAGGFYPTSSTAAIVCFHPEVKYF
ncbi:homocysteine S-methyltransferase family protein [Desulfoluna sp.]|uniref:homocysteine S-methyltransferase family protein n=1 Tax=Desulfoluna sp. TaxID=2045199 RepID=UPI002631596B|nr:homocysteine S-methyltransferase family protein [Desulfoluna sp.]